MKNALLTTQLFDQTTVNVHGLETYLSALPVYQELGVTNGDSPQTLELLSYADAFEFAFRCYLCGRTLTMHQVFSEIQRFQQLNPITSWHLIACSLEIVEKTLLHFESYELMPRYQQARNLIEDKYNIDLDGCLRTAKMRIGLH